MAETVRPRRRQARGARRIAQLLDVAADVPPVERYTYVFDQNSQQLDHVFASSSVIARGVAVEHVHVNNWAASMSARASDHDPSVGRLKLCGAKPQVCDLKIGKWCAKPLPSFSNRATCL